ncbi:MAG TPA: HD domain-containing protein [Acidimicrobiia bacterium]|nr:HD domain-containing protein [Acidimicrobiia bacterium]
MRTAFTTTRFRDCDELIAALRSADHLDDGEAVTVLAHSLQCAAILERVAPQDAELQIGGLVHDLGTILEPGAPDTHAATGAAAIEGLLGPRVATLVALHDAAKRYLVTTEPQYRHRLSERSRLTLRVQGGLLDPVQRSRLERDPHLEAALTLRRADDEAKQPGVLVPGLAHWYPLLHVVAHRA